MRADKALRKLGARIGKIVVYRDRAEFVADYGDGATSNDEASPLDTLDSLDSDLPEPEL